jgi:cysteinyl-tRNA synthetase
MALAALHEAVRRGNASIDAGELAAAQLEQRAVTAMADVLGLNPEDAAWAGSGSEPKGDQVLAHLVEALIAERAQARANKDFSRSDSIRDQLAAAGILLEDAADGTNWSIS